jgi:hypothetical protein
VSVIVSVRVRKARENGRVRRRVRGLRLTWLTCHPIAGAQGIERKLCLLRPAGHCRHFVVLQGLHQAMRHCVGFAWLGQTSGFPASFATGIRQLLYLLCGCCRFNLAGSGTASGTGGKTLSRDSAMSSLSNVCALGAKMCNMTACSGGTHAHRAVRTGRKTVTNVIQMVEDAWRRRLVRVVVCVTAMKVCSLFTEKPVLCMADLYQASRPRAHVNCLLLTSLITTTRPQGRAWPNAKLIQLA